MTSLTDEQLVAEVQCRLVTAHDVARKSVERAKAVGQG
jgi:hypothetical protein